MLTRAGQPTWLRCGAVCGGGVQEGTVPLALLSARFQSLPLLPTSKVGPSGADSQEVGLCTFKAPVGLSNELSCEAGSFSHCHLNPPRCPQPEVLRLYFPVLEPWVVQSDSLPSCSSQFICTQMWDHQSYQPPPCHESSLPGCPVLPLLLVWMNVSSLTPWLLDFHIVRFFVSSGCFLFLNCCCPSFGCARRHSVSTYASILANSLKCRTLDPSSSSQASSSLHSPL